jgi:hypothetical protein
MADWSDPTNFQLEALLEALLHAYPAPNDMTLLLGLKLNKVYAQYAPAHTGYRAALYEVLIGARGEGWLVDLITAALQDRPRNPKLLTLDRTADLSRIPEVALEAIVRHEGQFQDLYPWLNRLAGLAACICRIESPVNQAVGTGWLVGDDLVLTNWHVVKGVIGEKEKEKNVAFRFDYAADAQRIQAGTVYEAAADLIVASSAPGQKELGKGEAEPKANELDFALLRMRTSAAVSGGPSRTPVRLDRAGNLAPGGIVFVLQHPNGAPVKLAAGVAKGKNPNGTRLYHDANTQPGSSGSMCLNAKLEVVGLHNAGDTLYDGVLGTPNQNQAVPIGPIFQMLSATGHLGS